MATARELLKLPFTATWYLAKLLFWPAALVGVAWLGWRYLGLSSGWFAGICLVAGLLGLVLVRLWLFQVTGVLRSLARGTVRMNGYGPVRSRRRGRGGW